MLCRTANWSLFKKEPLPGNARFGCFTASKFENERVSQFVPFRVGTLMQHICKPLAICELWEECADLPQRYITYPNQWIVRGGSVQWSPNLTPLDFFLWGSMEFMVYVTPVTSEEDHITRVHGAIGSLIRQPHLFGHVYEAQHRRCRLCTDIGGILWTLFVV